MKQFKAKVRIKLSRTSSSTVETIVTANSQLDATRLVKAQYGSNLESVINVSEIR